MDRIQSMGDTSIYLLFQDNSLSVINGTFVGDILRCRTPEFIELYKQTYAKLEITETEELPFTFAGINIQLQPDDTLTID